MYEILIILIAVILTGVHFFLKLSAESRRHKAIYFVQFFALYTSFSITEHFFEKTDGQFVIGALGFLLFIVNLLLMVSKRKN
ncbi:hypothetical protein N483_26330 [Pseudoalteromonas luteoviolacea NCIMB 1944]|uniref:Uncharacterized protein n=1 Tax=Pseudoalteromonas luteoviolacea (strain 2ta16) TaxID=1353533 RepID=V4HWT8_PSEL2|nr:hypothetical protein PL2TA16_01951 [Pseudoalteromonas luteoviolacea 2ta16]KZN33291.1 hypothetical protein N483_26330 [Pseudoalteromonas luteoviolacea NCIMB 1944]